MNNSEWFAVSLRDAALAVLGRNLTKDEENEFLNFAAAIGGNNAKDFLYMTLSYHKAALKVQSETEKMQETMNVSVAKIDDSLKRVVDEHEKLKDEVKAQFKDTIRKATEEIMKENIASMKNSMDDHAKEILDKNKEYFSLRVAIMLIVALGIACGISYIFGAFGFQYVVGPERGFIARVIGALTNLKLGWWVLYATFACGVTWGVENWQDILHVKEYQIKAITFAAVGLILLLAALYA
jgi:hypothetical protein